jgi:hypothetical protein
MRRNIKEIVVIHFSKEGITFGFDLKVTAE